MVKGVPGVINFEALPFSQDLGLAQEQGLIHVDPAKGVRLGCCDSAKSHGPWIPVARGNHFVFGKCVFNQDIYG